MRRLATSVVPRSFGHAQHWRDGSRRWAWARRQLITTLPASDGSSARDDEEVGEAAWRAAFGVDDGAELDVERAWRACALCLAMLREVDLAATVPRNEDVESSGGWKALGVPPQALAWLLMLFHAGRGSQSNEREVSRALRLELRAFVAARLLPYLCTLAPDPAQSDALAAAPLMATLTRTAIGGALKGLRGAADAVGTLLRCALHRLPTLALRRAAAAALLASAGLPGALVDLRSAAPSLVPLIARVVSAGDTERGASSLAEAAAIIEVGKTGDDVLSSLSSQASRTLMSLRPAASAASRAALARLGQAAGPEEELRELSSASAALRSFAELLPLSSDSRGAADSSALFDQCMKLDDMRQSAKGGDAIAAAAAALRSAVCEALGSLSTAASDVHVRLLQHASWIGPLLEEHMRAAASTKGSSTAAGTQGPERVGVRSCMLVALQLRAAAAAQCDEAADAAEASADEAAARALAAGKALIAKTDRTLQLSMTWLLAHGIHCGRQLGAQRTLRVCIAAALTIPPEHLRRRRAPSPPSVPSSRRMIRRSARQSLRSSAASPQGTSPSRRLGPARRPARRLTMRCSARRSCVPSTPHLS